MVLGFLRRKSKQPRNPDGTFAGLDGNRSATARGVRSDIQAVSDTLKSAFSLVGTIQDHALADMERRTRYRDMVDDLESSMESDDDSSFEKMAMQLILTHLQNQPRNPGSQSESDLWGQGTFIMPHDESAASAHNEAPQIPQTKDQGVDRLNHVLKGISAIPDKVVSKKAVDKICEMEGIDKRALEIVVKKLSPVMAHGTA